MNTILSFVLSCACLTAGVQGAAQPRLREQAAKADLIVIAEVVEVGESPGFWGGGYLLPKQSVTYRQVGVLKGSLSHSQFEVGFYITSVSSRVDKDRPMLSPEIFAPGKKHVLFLNSAVEDTSNKVPTMTEEGKVVLKDASEVSGAAGPRKVPVATGAGNISFEDASEHNKLYAFEPAQVITVLTADANTIQTLRAMISEK